MRAKLRVHLFVATVFCLTVVPAEASATPAGQITNFSAGLNAGSLPNSIAPGPDGNLWFTDQRHDQGDRADHADRDHHRLHLGG